MTTRHTKHWMPLVLVLGLSSTLLVGCGGGGYFAGGGYAGDVEVDNRTDFGGTFEDIWFFEMAPSGTALWTGNLLAHDVWPGDVQYLGLFAEDFYDADADLDFHSTPFFGVPVQDGLTTTFDVF